MSTTIRVAMYGKGGIGKSTMSSNITAALSCHGHKVLQIGCDPKHDSTRLLLGGNVENTILSYLKDTRPEDRKLEDVIAVGYRGCLCAEAGGPEPGVGCAGRGIISSFQLLSELGVDSIERDVTLYDVLGDVVCGGFAVPLRNEYADIIFIVSSGEFMSIYAANNILKGISNYDPNRVGGIIFNSRGDPEENGRIKRFSEATGVPIIASFERSELFMSSEEKGMTVVEAYPDSGISSKFYELSDRIMEMRKYTAHSLSEDELERCVLGRAVHSNSIVHDKLETAVMDHPKKRYASRNVVNDEPYGGCAFSGAHNVCASIEGLTTILHSPRSCAYFAFQTVPSTVARYNSHHRPICRLYDPSVICTDMDEDDMIFGGISKLERNLKKCVSEGNADIAIITSCPSGIIGDDVKGLIERTENENKGVRISLIEADGSLNGDFIQGIIDATISLCERFSTECEITDTVNLIGTKPMSLNTLNSVELYTRMLDSIGIGVNCVLPGCDSVESISKVRAAKLNLMMCPDVFAIQIGTFLDERYGVHVCPIAMRPGISGTLSWLGFVAEEFGHHDLYMNAVKDLRNDFSKMIAPYKRITEGKTYCILSASKDIDWIVEAANEAGMINLRTVVVNRSDYCNDINIENEVPNIILTDHIDIDAERNIIEEMTPDIIISTVPIGVETKHISIPLVPVADPFLGVGFIKKIARSFVAPEKEGWREDDI